MTYDELYKTIDFPYIYCKANELLVSSNVITTFPYKVADFIKEQSDVKLCKYLKSINKYNISPEIFGSESAEIMEMAGAYIIFYNQDEPDYRIRFSIMHEFGHLILNHKMNLKKDNLLYSKQEVEANCFSAQMLMPEQIIRQCQKRGYNISTNYLADSFSVSYDAAIKRRRTIANTMYEWKSRTEKEYDDLILLKYADKISSIAPKKNSYYYFEDEYEKQKERDNWCIT